MEENYNSRPNEHADVENDIYAVPKLYCTICLHDLNHPIYFQCTHPILSVPLCVICHEDILRSDLFNELVEESDVCTWCGDGGDLLMCSNEEHCDRSFCKTCIENNFSTNTLHAIENNDDWLCFCCAFEPLDPFKAALASGQALSLYNQGFSAEQESRGEELDKPSEPSEQDLEIQRNLSLLKAVIEEGAEASKNLEDGALSSKEAEIRTELRETNTDHSVSVHLQAKEELAVWKAYWMRHFDILQVQEAALFEALYALNCDPRQFPEYNASYATLTSNLSSEEKMALRSAEQELNNTTSPGKHTSKGISNGSSTSGKKKHVPIAYEEAVVEVDTDNKLPEYEALALKDPLVQQYANNRTKDSSPENQPEVPLEEPVLYPEIHPDRYPQSFAAVVPKSVLHAFFYATQKERRQLSLTYSIPPHIAIIMRQLSVHNDKEFPHSSDRWSFASTVHPAVRLALYYSESATETVILCDHYNLPEDTGRITEFGSTDEVLNMYNKTIKARNVYNKSHNSIDMDKVKFNSREVKDAEEDEYERDANVLNDYIQVTSKSSGSGGHSSSSNSSARVRTERIQSLLKPMIKNDTADVEKCQKERQRFVKSMNSAHKGTRKKSSSSRGSEDVDSGAHRSRTSLLPTSTITGATADNTVKKPDEPLLELPPAAAAVNSVASSTTVPQAPTENILPPNRSDITVHTTAAPEPEEQPGPEPEPEQFPDDFGAGAGDDVEYTNNYDMDEFDAYRGKGRRRRPCKKVRMKLKAEAEARLAAKAAAAGDVDTSMDVDVPVETGKVAVKISVGCSINSGSTVPTTQAATIASPEATTTSVSSTTAITPKPNDYTITTPVTANTSPAYFVDMSEDSQLGAPVPIETENTSELRDMATAMEDSLHDAYPTNSSNSVVNRSTSNDSREVIDLVSSDDEEDVPPLKNHASTSTRDPSAAKPLFMASSTTGAYVSSPLLSSTPLLELTSSSNTAHKAFAPNSSSVLSTSSATKPTSITTTGAFTTTSGKAIVVSDFFLPRPASATKKRSIKTITYSDSDVGSDGSNSEEDIDPTGKKQRLSGPFSKSGKSGSSSSSSKKKNSKDTMVWEKETLQVAEAEKKRLRALASHKHFKDDGFVLNENRPEGDPAVRVIQQFEKDLKTHQKEGLRFMWENVMGSVSSASSSNKDVNTGGGCILAHCMGLGKTLSVIAFTATLLAHPDICKIVDPYQPSDDKKCAVSSLLSDAATSVSATTVGASTASSTSTSDSALKTSDSDSGSSGGVSGIDTANTNTSNITTIVDTITATAAASTHPPLTSAPSMGLLKPPIHPSTYSATSAVNNATKPNNPHITTTYHLLANKPLVHTVLVIAPKNTLENWINEYKRWTPTELHVHTNVTSIMTGSNNRDTIVERVKKLRSWYTNGGVMVMGYDMYRLLTNLDDKKLKVGATFVYNTVTDKQVPIPSSTSTPQLAYVHEARLYLQYPGPDLVVADEAHIIKEKKARISQLVNEIRTKRRIALTGSPLQNNLEEYWCMISFVKYRFLGAYKEFQKYYVVPIKKGSNADSSGVEKRRMKQRTHLLFKKLTPVVHRRDMSVLEADLLPKREFVISVKMTPVQCYMYKYFINLLSNLNTNKKLLIGYNSLLRVWNHPGCVVMNFCKAFKAAEKLNNKVIAANAAAAAASAESNADSSSTGAAVSSSVVIIDRVSPPTITAVSSTATTVPSLYEKLQQSNKPSVPDKASLLYMREQLQSTLQHYIEHGSKVSDEMEQHASQMEDSLLNSNINTTATPSKSARRDCDDPSSDDENDDAEHDSGSDLDGFIVDDDVIEYEDDSGEDNQKEAGSDREYTEGRKRTRSSKKRRKSGKRLRTDSSDFDEGAITTAVTDIIVDAGADNAMDTAMDSSLQHANANTSTTTLSLPLSLPPSRASTPLGAFKDDSEIEEAGDNGENAATTLLDAEIVYDEEKEDELTKTTIPIDWWKMTPEEATSAADNITNADPNTTTMSNPPMKSSKALHLPDDLSLLQLSNKMVTLLTLLMLSCMEDDKMLVFSQSIYSLDMIELFLNMPRWDRLIDCVQNDPSNATKNNMRYTFSNWSRDREYLRIDGVSGNRQKTIDKFNQDPKHKLMLISTKAGNMGINLQAANRVVIFDTSWNPVHDLQAMYRAYRYGQKKSVYVYRLLSAGSMEEKIYRRQVTKQSLSARVVDAQMPDNHFTDEELMTFDSDTISGTLDKAEQVLQKGAGDAVLSRFIRYFGSDLLVSIEDHGGMLEDNIDEHLTAEEQALAVAELESEMKTALLPPPVPTGFVAGGAVGVRVVPGTSNSHSSSSSSGAGVGGGNVDVSMNIHMGSGSSSASGGVLNCNRIPSLEALFPNIYANKSAERDAGAQRYREWVELKAQHSLQQQQQQQSSVSDPVLDASNNVESASLSASHGTVHSSDNNIRSVVDTSNNTSYAPDSVDSVNYTHTDTNVSNSASNNNNRVDGTSSEDGEVRALQKQEEKCDQLIVFAQSASRDPTFAVTLRLLKQLFPTSHYTEADVRERYAHLVTSGRAAAIQSQPRMKKAIAERRAADGGV